MPVSVDSVTFFALFGISAINKSKKIKIDILLNVLSISIVNNSLFLILLSARYQLRFDGKMLPLRWLIFLLLQLVALQVVTAEVTILRSNQFIYTATPKLRIRGTGFDVDEQNIVLELGAIGQNFLTADKDYVIAKDPEGDGLILKLLSNRR